MTRTRNNPGVRGFTLLEVIVAVAVASMMALALATVMSTVARTINGAGDERGALQRGHAANFRLRAYTTPALALIQHDPQRGFALWLEDTTPGNTVNLREIRAVWFNQELGVIELERVSFPEDWPEELKASFDTQLSPGSDFLSEIQTQRTLGYTRREDITDGVTDWALRHDAVLPDASRLFWLTLELDAGQSGARSLVSAHSLVNYVEPR